MNFRIAGRPVRRQLRHAVVLAGDVAIGAASFVAAYLTAVGLPQIWIVPGLPEKTLAFMLCCMGAFLFMGIQRSAWRYVSVPDLVAIVKAVVLAVAIYTIAAFILTRGDNVPRSVPILSAIYMLTGLAGIRLCYRLLVEKLTTTRAGRASALPSGANPVLLVGLTDKAESLIRAVKRDPSRNYQVVGVLDDSHIHVGRYVQGVRVLGGLDQLQDMLARLAAKGTIVREIVVTETAPGRRRLEEILEAANRSSLTVSRIPDFLETAALAQGALLEPKRIEIGDLLERPQIKADPSKIAGLIADKVVLVTGAGGSIGSELCRQIASFSPRRMILSDASEFLLFTLDTELRDNFPKLDIVTRIMDVRDRNRVDAVFGEFLPEAVFHAAALKHVPLMEDNPAEAIKTNLIGTRNAADAAVASGASVFVMISTDKAVGPTNIMGATKRAAEAYCQSLDVTSPRTRFKTVRFGNVLGSNGSVVPRFQQQIAAGGPVTVTHPEMTRYFMTIPEAVSLVLNACAHGVSQPSQRGKILVLDMGRPVRIRDLAERMIQLAGYKPGVDIEIVYSGLRPGEKLYEELFQPDEVREERAQDGYFIASPQVIDRVLLDRTMQKLAECLAKEDVGRAVGFLLHIVPQYVKSGTVRAPKTGGVRPGTLPDGVNL